MKARFGYVSNSSSSSYFIYNWKDLPDEKKRKVLEYWKYAYQVWMDAGVEMEYDKVNKSVNALNQDGWRLDDESKDPIDRRLAFGWIEVSPCWYFREDKEDGVLDMWTVMENFAMDKWLDYIGGIKYRCTGEYSAYDTNEYKNDHDALKEFMENTIKENTK